MISKEQYKEILDICTSYVEKYNEMFPGKMSNEYAEGFRRVLDLIETMVEK